MSARSLQKFIKLLEFTLANCMYCFNKKLYKQLQGAAMGSPVSPVIANIYMEYFESLAILTSPTLIKWWLGYVDDVHSSIRKKSSQQTPRATQFHRSTHQIHHRTPRSSILDAQKTDIIYHWKCPANNCTVEYIGETNRSLKERVSDHRNQTTSSIRNHHISTKHPKAEFKDFTIIDTDRTPYFIEQKKHFTFISKIHHLTETLAKSESLEYSTNF